MARIFTYLAISNLLVFGGVAALGVVKLDAAPDRHVLLAVFALMVSMLVQVITFTYFTVTGKMMFQAMHLGKLGLERMAEVKDIKRCMARNIAGIFISVLLATATGGMRWREGRGMWLHLVAAMILITCHVFLLIKEYILVVNNAKLLDEVMGDYEAQKKPL